MSNPRMPRMLLLGDGTHAELRPSIWQFYIELSEIRCETAFRQPSQHDAAEVTWKVTRLIRGLGKLPFQTLTTLKADGSSGSRFRDFNTSIIQKPLHLPLPIRLGDHQFGGSEPSYLVHGSARPAEAEMEASPEFIELTVALPIECFDAAWDELKFGQGNIVCRLSAEIENYQPVWPDDYYIACDQIAKAEAVSFEVIRSPHQLSARPTD